MPYICRLAILSVQRCLHVDQTKGSMGNSIPHTTTVGGSGCRTSSKLGQIGCPIKTDDMAEKSWQVMHMNVMKGITAAQSNEHQRNWTESGWKHAIDKGTYDRQRERLNFEIVKGGKVRPVC